MCRLRHPICTQLRLAQSADHGDETQAVTVEKRVGKVGRGERAKAIDGMICRVLAVGCTLGLGMGSRVPQPRHSRDRDQFCHRLDDRFVVLGAVGALLGPVELRAARQNWLLRLASRGEPMRDLLLRLHTPAASISIVCSSGKASTWFTYVSRGAFAKAMNNYQVCEAI